MRSMILAAGYGTRLRPITWTMPKPLVPVCNRPLIAYAVDNYLRAGVDEVIVNVHHLPEALERYLVDEFKGRCRFHFSYEDEILGTGGGVRRVRSLLESQEEFYLVNGDTIQSPPYAALSRARRERNAIAALTLRHPPEGDRFTAVWLDDGRITGFGKGTGEPLMFSGSHAIISRAFAEMPDREVFGIVEEVYTPQLTRQGVAGVVDDGLWFDIGKPARYLGASDALREAMIRGDFPLPPHSRVERSSIIHETATAASSVNRSVVGANSGVEGEVLNTAIWEDCRIGPGVKLDSCIVATGVQITQSMELKNAVICRDEPAIPRDAGYELTDGLVISTFDAPPL